LSLLGSNTLISCDEAEARNLLLYAGHCPGVVASIHHALRSARLPLEPPKKSPERDSKRSRKDFSPSAVIGIWQNQFQFSTLPAAQLPDSSDVNAVAWC
jgi:hypothetical protein